MAAVLLEPFPLDPARPRHPVGAYRQPGSRSARRPARAVLRRRRQLAALVGLGLVLTVARAGAALEGSSLANPERLPHVRTVVVEPGDSLWSIAGRVAPGSDPRNVVDAIVDARGGNAAVNPGERITWVDS
jgi:hypothetical protein